MKHLRSMLASIIAIMMAFTMGGTAFASAEGHTITLSEDDTHTYKIYQVLTGTLEHPDSNPEDTQLGDPTWGADVKDDVKQSKEVSDFIADITAEGITPEQIADLVYDVVDLDKGSGEVKPRTPKTGLVTGYYVMVDTTTLAAYGEDPEKIDTKALHVVKVVNNINGMAIKWGTTQNQKTIVSDTLGDVDNNNPHAVDGSIDNVSIGDTVNYKITAKIPSNANNYNYFYFVINDTLDAGLDLVPNSIKVYKDSINDNNLLNANDDNGYVLKTGDEAGNYSFQVGLKNAKSMPNTDIIVTYSAILNEKAEVGQTSNNNTSTVNFSNDPNADYNGEEYPCFPYDVTDSAIGVTPAAQTKTYTTGIEIVKIDESDKALTGAEFTLTGESTQWVITIAEAFEEDENGEYYKLKDGTYTKTVPTDSEYMEETPGANAGYVVDADYNGEDKKVVGGITYRPYAPDKDGTETVYAYHNGNSELYANTGIKYKKTTTTKTKGKTQDEAIKMFVGDDGIAKFVGLGAGDYTITESTTPSGYNTAADVNVTITLDENGNWINTGNGDNVVYDASEGLYKVTIKNFKGTALPSTGGIGTTIFYIVGGVMVAGAVVFLLTKRRIASNE